MKPYHFFLILTLSLFLTSCESDMYDRVRGTGPVVSENRIVSAHEGVTVSIPADIYLYQGDQDGITIEAQENILEVIETEVRDHKLRLKFQNGVHVTRHEPIKVYITSPDINQIHVSGSGSVYAETPIITNALEIMISGSGLINIYELEAEELEAHISGSGKILVEGVCDEQYLRISGSGDIHNFDLWSESVDVQISGSGKSEITVNDYLNARISGSGNIYYKGDPRIDSSISGSGGIYSVP